MDYADGFSYIEPFLYSWDDAYWILINDVFDVSWIQFWSILFNTLISRFIREIGLRFSYFLESFCGVGIRVNVTLYNEFGSVPSVSIFVE